VVLGSWVEAIGSPTDTARAAAVVACERDGWPADAVAVAEILVRFTAARVAPVIIDGWEQIAAIADEEQWVRAMRAERTALRDSDEEDRYVNAWAMDQLIAAIVAARKARRLADGPQHEWGAATPMGLSRTTARRCGELLGLGDEPAVAELLADLPATPAS
jgi:hypothetical protein